jgi:hypothetical protein
MIMGILFLCSVRDLDSIDLESLRNEAAAGDSANLQGLYDIAFSLTSELLLLELTHRIVVCFFEVRFKRVLFGR